MLPGAAWSTQEHPGSAPPPSALPPPREAERESLSLVSSGGLEAEWRGAVDRMLAAYPAEKYGGTLAAERALFDALRSGGIRLDGQPAPEHLRSLTVSEWCAAVMAWRRSAQWTREGGQFITWLPKFISAGLAFNPPAPRGQNGTSHDRGEAPHFDVPQRLERLAAAVPEDLADIAASIRSAATSIGGDDHERIESALADLDVRMVRLVEERHPDVVADLTGVIAADLARGGMARRIPAEQRLETEQRLRIQALRGKFRLPLLSLFSPEAEA